MQKANKARAWGLLCSRRPQAPSRWGEGTDCLLHILGDWNAKVGSRETPGVTGKFGLGVQNEAGQKANRVLPREHTGHSKYPLPTTQEKLYTWTSQDRQTESD